MPMRNADGANTGGSLTSGAGVRFARTAAIALIAIVSAAITRSVRAQSIEPLVEIPVVRAPAPASQPAEPAAPAETVEMVKPAEPGSSGGAASGSEAGAEAPESPAAAVPSDPAVEASAPDESPHPIRSDADRVIELNRGIQMYLAEDQFTEEKEKESQRLKAMRIFQEISLKYPDDLACLYYLGLIKVESGVHFSRMSTDCRKEAYKKDNKDNLVHSETEIRQWLDKSQNWATEAQQRFEDAKVYFGQVVDKAQELKSAEGGLFLGIAQLAAEQGAGAGKAGDDERARIKDMIESPEFLENSRKAEGVLTEYVNGDGQDDQYGHFFLAIAKFRLGLRTKDQPYASLRKDAINEFDVSIEKANEKNDLSDPLKQSFKSTADYYKALIKLLNGDFGTGKAELKEIVDGEYSVDLLKNNAKDLIDYLNSHPPGRPPPTLEIKSDSGSLSLQGNITTGGIYDTNVILLGKQQALPAGIPHKDDWRLGLSSGLDLQYYADAEQMKHAQLLGKSLLLGVGGQVANLWNGSIEEYQENVYSGRAYALYEPLDNFLLGVNYDYTHFKLGGAQFYNGNRVIPTVSYIWREGWDRNKDERARTDLYYIYEGRRYKDEIPDERFDRTGPYQAVGLTQSFNLVKAGDLWKSYYSDRSGDSAEARGGDADRWARVSAGYLYRDEQTRGTEFDLVSHSVFGGIEIPLPWRLAFDFRATFSWDDYLRGSALDYRGNPRADFIQDYQFGLTYILIGRGESEAMKSLEMKLRGSIDAWMQDSNIWNRLGEEPYSYNRNTYGLQLMINF